MKKRILITSVAAIVVLAGLSTVYAQRDGSHRGRSQMRRPAMAALDLTAEQRTQMQSLRSTHVKATAPLKAEVVVARTELQELMRQKTPNAGAVRKAVDKLSKAQGKVLLAKTEHRLSTKSVLTDEQWQKMNERKAWGERPGGRKGGRRGGAGDRGERGSGHGFGHGMGADIPAPIDAPVGS